MQIDKLVHLIESPVFVHVRLQLLDVEAPYHTYLLKSCYGLLMILPQSDAFRSLNDRLTAVCNLRDNLGVKPSMHISASTDGIFNTEDSSIYKAGLDAILLLDRFDKVMAMHQIAREAIQRNGHAHGMPNANSNDKVFGDHEQQTAVNKRNIKGLNFNNKSNPVSSLSTGTNIGPGTTTSLGNVSSTGPNQVATSSRQRAGIGAVIASGVK